jgi:hypothetical protein
MKMGVLAAISAAFLPVLAACGGSPGPAYYVYAGGSGQSRAVVLVEWSAPEGNQIQGVITYNGINLANAPQESLSVSSVPFTGTINGNSVTVATSGLFAGTTINGTLGRGTLTITLPPDSSTGAIQSATLIAASVSGYNSDVASLRAAISHANVLAAQRQARQQQQQQDAQDLNTAQGDLSALRQDAGPGGNLPGDLQTLSGDVETIAGDVTTVQQDLAQPGNSDCFNQQSASDDAIGAGDDTAGLGDDVTGLLDDVDTIRQDIATVRSDLATLNSDRVPPPAGSSRAISAAQSAIALAKASADGYITKGNTQDQQAFAIANAAATGPCAGDGPGRPSNLVPLLH